MSNLTEKILNRYDKIEKQECIICKNYVFRLNYCINCFDKTKIEEENNLLMNYFKKNPNEIDFFNVKLEEKMKLLIRNEKICKKESKNWKKKLKTLNNIYFDRQKQISNIIKTYFDFTLDKHTTYEEKCNIFMKYGYEKVFKIIIFAINNIKINIFYKNIITITDIKNDMLNNELIIYDNDNEDNINDYKDNIDEIDEINNYKDNIDENNEIDNDIKLNKFLLKKNDLEKKLNDILLNIIDIPDYKEDTINIEPSKDEKISNIKCNIDISRQFWYAYNDFRQLYYNFMVNIKNIIPPNIYICNRKATINNNHILLHKLLQTKIKNNILNITTECSLNIKQTKFDYRFDIFGIVKSNDGEYFQFIIETDELHHLYTSEPNDIIKDMYCIMNSISILRINLTKNEKISNKHLNIAINFLKKIITTNYPVFSITQKYINSKTKKYKEIIHDINLNPKYNWLSPFTKLKLKLEYQKNNYKINKPKINKKKKEIKTNQQIKENENNIIINYDPLIQHINDLCKGKSHIEQHQIILKYTKTNG